ncbi:hypothetical protein ANCCAN_10531, partial [Ancylostoma caninum]
EVGRCIDVLINDRTFSDHDERAWVAARQQGPTFLLASILSSGAGIIQAHGLKSFPELTVYQPLITDSESRAALLIILTSVPYHTLFVSVSHIIAYAALRPLKLSFVFLAGYMCAVFIQIFFLVYIAQVIVYWMYYFRIDPDMHAIPMVTAIGDLVGTALLVSLFYLCAQVKCNVRDTKQCDAHVFIRVNAVANMIDE